MAKLTKKLIEEITLFIEQDNYTIGEICRMFGISRKTFYEWKAKKPEFSEAVDEAIGNRHEMLVTLAKKGLRERLSGYTVYTEKVVMTPDEDVKGGYKVLKKECCTREYGPDLKAIKYVLECEAKRKEEEHGQEEIVLPEEGVALTEEEQKEKLLIKKYGDILKIEEEKARHHVMFLRDKMQDGTHPQLTGKPIDPDWEKEYVGL